MPSRRLSVDRLTTSLRASDSMRPYYGAYTNQIYNREILSGRPYGLATDIWSLGCVMVTCLSGQPAFNVSRHYFMCISAYLIVELQGSTPENIFDNISNARYTLPDSCSYELQDFVSGLLQKVCL